MNSADRRQEWVREQSCLNIERHPLEAILACKSAKLARGGLPQSLFRRTAKPMILANRSGVEPEELGQAKMSLAATIQRALELEPIDA